MNTLYILTIIIIFLFGLNMPLQGVASKTIEGLLSLAIMGILGLSLFSYGLIPFLKLLGVNLIGTLFIGRIGHTIGLRLMRRQGIPPRMD